MREKNKQTDNIKQSSTHSDLAKLTKRIYLKIERKNAVTCTVFLSINKYPLYSAEQNRQCDIQARKDGTKSKNHMHK